MARSFEYAPGSQFYAQGKSPHYLVPGGGLDDQACRYTGFSAWILVSLKLRRSIFAVREITLAHSFFSFAFTALPVVIEWLVARSQ